VKMREENRVQTLQWQACECCYLRRAGAGINQVKRLSGPNRDAGLSTAWRRQRRRRTTHEYLEAIEFIHRR
jgi:hypothetical protein